MNREVRPTDADEAQDGLVYEPVADHALERAMGLILESIRRRQPSRTIQ